MEYRINELSLTLPGAGWRDTTSHHLQLPAPDGTLVSLDIVREPPIARAALAERVDADLRGHARELRGYQLVTREPFETGAVSGVRTSFRTVTPLGAVQHEVAYVALPEVLFLFVVRGNIKHAAECGELLREAVMSIRLR